MPGVADSREIGAFREDGEPQTVVALLTGGQQGGDGGLVLLPLPVQEKELQNVEGPAEDGEVAEGGLEGVFHVAELVLRGWGVERRC